MSTKFFAVVTELFELVAACLRRVRLYVLVALMFGVSACTPVAVKRMMADLPPAGYAYYLNYAQFDSFLPDWYQLYSMLPGPKGTASQCVARNTYSLRERKRHLKVINCSNASRSQVERLADKLQATLNAVERRFNNEIHVSNIVISLYRHGIRVEEHSTHVVRPKHLTFEMAAVYMAYKPHHSERDIIRSVAHELFHVVRYVTRRDRASTIASNLPEEIRASLFESCIDFDVYGSIERSAFEKDMQFDPNWFKDAPVGYVSATGGSHAYAILSDIAGTDHRLSSASERRRFNRLCRQVVH